MNVNTALAPTRALTPAQSASFLDNGYLLLERVVPDGFLAGVQRLLEGVVDDTIETWRASGRIDQRFDEADFGTRYHRAWVAAGRPSDVTKPFDERFSMQSLTQHASLDWLGRFAAELLDTDRAAPLASCFYRAKFPDDATTNLPWHQDAQCLEPISGINFVTTWIPLDDVSVTNSCLDVSPVGADQGMLEAAWSERSGYVCMREPDCDGLTDVRPVAMRRGDALLLSPFTPHRSLTNRSARIRWSVDVRFAPRPGSRPRACDQR